MVTSTALSDNERTLSTAYEVAPAIRNGGEAVTSLIDKPLFEVPFDQVRYHVRVTTPITIALF